MASAMRALAEVEVMKDRKERTVVFVGAGATAACGGPLTNDLLPLAFGLGDEAGTGRDPLIGGGDPSSARLAERFLVEMFDVPPRHRDRRSRDYPPLPIVLSLMDLAVERGQAFGARWTPATLRRARLGLESAIHEVLKERLEPVDLQDNPYVRLFEHEFFGSETPPVVISLNYDTLADCALVEWHRRHLRRDCLPSYGCWPDTNVLAAPGEDSAKLYKLHGCLCWEFCPVCGRLRQRTTNLGRRLLRSLGKTIDEADSTDTLYRKTPICPYDQGECTRVLIAPTYRKDYRNFHLAQVWYAAEQQLRQATRLVFVGYSLPESDVEVLYLIKRSCPRRNFRGRRITVVEFDASRRGLGEHPVGQRYEALFGREVEWHVDGLTGWLDGGRPHLEASGSPPVEPAPVAAASGPASGLRGTAATARRISRGGPSPAP